MSPSVSSKSPGTTAKTAQDVLFTSDRHRATTTSRRHFIASQRQFPGAHEILQLDVKSDGEAIDVIEVTDDLSGVVNGIVVKAIRSQQFDIAVPDPGRIVGEPFGIAAQRHVGRAEIRCVPVRCQPMNEGICVRVTQFVLGDLSTEVVSVGAQSVNTSIPHRHDHGKHFAPQPRQR